MILLAVQSPVPTEQSGAVSVNAMKLPQFPKLQHVKASYLKGENGILPNLDIGPCFFGEAGCHCQTFFSIQLFAEHTWPTIRIEPEI